jgi:hypothetical protein
VAAGLVEDDVWLSLLGSSRAVTDRPSATFGLARIFPKEPFAMRYEIDSLNWKSGPALIAMNGWPFSSKATTPQSPDGVSPRILTLVIFEFGKTEQ